MAPGRGSGPREHTWTREPGAWTRAALRSGHRAFVLDSMLSWQSVVPAARLEGEDRRTAGDCWREEGERLAVRGEEARAAREQQRGGHHRDLEAGLTDATLATFVTPAA